MEEPQRPLPLRSPRDRVRAWIEWFGFGRILGSAVAVSIVCGGAYWLVRTPPPPTEVLLPVVSTSIATASTLADAADVGAAELLGDAVRGPVPIVVHVAGAVVTPGVYELVDGARVEEALAAADGPLPDADPNALNLAAPLVDGSRIYVPLIGEEVAVLPAVPVPADGIDGDGTAAVIDVNEASAAELEDLPGVGPATATAIVAERDRNGPFLSVDDLDRVPGIGPGKIEALRELVTT